MIAWSSATRISAPFSALDLADPSSPQRIVEEIERRRIHVDLFVNSAEISLHGECLSYNPRQEQAEVEGECAGGSRSRITSVKQWPLEASWH